MESPLFTPMALAVRAADAEVAGAPAVLNHRRSQRVPDEEAENKPHSTMERDAVKDNVATDR